MRKDFKELYSVQLAIPVKIDGKAHVPGRFSEGTASITIPAAIAFNYMDGDASIENLKSDERLGLEIAKKKVLIKPSILPDIDIEPLYHSIGKKDYTEPHGLTKGIVHNRMEYRGYVSNIWLSPGDFQKHVKFVPVDKLQESALETEDPVKELYMDIGGGNYRINYGITRCVEEMDKFNVFD